MKTTKTLIMITVLTVLFISCNKNPKGVYWGETNYYEDFLSKKYTPVKMEKTLVFEFNDVAQNRMTNDIAFEIVERNENDLIVVAQGIVLSKNGNKCSDNILKVNPSEKEVVLGIEFTSDAHKGNHTLYLREKGNCGLDRIDYIELANGIVVKKNNVTNPLKKSLLWSLAITITILVICFIISRIINPSTKFSKIFIDYHDGNGEQRINMGSAYKLLCTNKKTKFSIFSKFFVGIVKVEVNEFWSHPVTIKSGTRNNIRISGLGEFELDSDETIRKEPFTITNDNEQKTTITTT